MGDKHMQMKGSEVFVGGLPVTITETAIRELFSECGEILEIRLIKDRKGSVKGYCFVRFSTKEAADKAVKDKSGLLLDGKKIGVLPSTEQDTLYLGNLNKGWSADEFEGIVRQVFPDVFSVDLATYSGEIESGKKRNRGFAFVKFTSHAAAARALRVGSKPEFILGNLHPAVQWAEEQPEIDPGVLSKIKIAFIRNLPPTVDENFVKKLFEPFGEIEKVVVWKKGSSPVGFVHFTKRSDLENAIRGMHDKVVQYPKGGQTHRLSVEVARPIDKSKKHIHEDSENSSVNKIPNNLDNTPTGKSEILFSGLMSGAQKGMGYEDPYEVAVLSLPVSVRERLLRILRLRIATRFDIDIHNINCLKQLSESTAISVLDQFMISGADVQNKGVYLAGLISRHQVEQVRVGQSPGDLRRVGGFASSGVAVSSFVDRDLYAPDDSIGLHVGSKRTRSERYDSCYSALVSDYPSFSRASIGRVEETSCSPLQPISTSYAPYEKLKSSPLIDDISGVPPTFTLFNRDNVVDDPLTRRPVRYGDMSDGPTSRYVDMADGRTTRPQLRFNDISGHPRTHLPVRLEGALDRPLTLSRPLVGFDEVADNRLPTQPRVRFDPYTGEPYKFDPYTGERILPDTTSHRRF